MTATAFFLAAASACAAGGTGDAGGDYTYDQHVADLVALIRGLAAAVASGVP